METRAVGSKPSPRIAATISPPSPPSTARRSRIWKSSSVEMSDMGQILGAARLFEQNLERRQLGVPFDQHRDRTEPPERGGVKLPDRFSDAGAVIVDQDADVLGSVMAGEVDLADRSGWKHLEIGSGVEAEIQRADVDVVDVAEDPAAGPPNDLAPDLGFRAA